jgi:hypothetical protein
VTVVHLDEQRSQSSWHLDRPSHAISFLVYLPCGLTAWTGSTYYWEAWGRRDAGDIMRAFWAENKDRCVLNRRRELTHIPSRVTCLGCLSVLGRKES